MIPAESFASETFHGLARVSAETITKDMLAAG
jgi:hypothetical protein